MESYEKYKIKGNEYFQKGEYNKAIEYYDECIILDPENPLAYSNKAMSLIKSGENEKAVRVCNLALTKINVNDSQHDTIQRKIVYRLNLAEKAIKNSVKDSAKIETWQEIIIQEVDKLPEEFASL